MVQQLFERIWDGCLTAFLARSYAQVAITSLRIGFDPWSPFQRLLERVVFEAALSTQNPSTLLAFRDTFGHAGDLFIVAQNEQILRLIGP